MTDDQMHDVIQRFIDFYPGDLMLVFSLVSKSNAICISSIKQALRHLVAIHHGHDGVPNGSNCQNRRY